MCSAVQELHLTNQVMSSLHKSPIRKTVRQMQIPLSCSSNKLISSLTQ